jgi:hypothetical protein
MERSTNQDSTLGTFHLRSYQKMTWPEVRKNERPSSFKIDEISKQKLLSKLKVILKTLKADNFSYQFCYSTKSKKSIMTVVDINQRQKFGKKLVEL